MPYLEVDDDDDVLRMILSCELGRMGD